MKTILLALASLLVAASAFAQVGATLKIQVYQAPVVGDITTVTPFRESAAIPITAAICGLALLPTPPPPVETNPRQALWNDPANPTTAVCLSNQAAFFAALPARGSATVAGYVSTLTITDNSGAFQTPTSPRSAAGNPFSSVPPLPLAPPAPTGHQVRP